MEDLSSRVEKLKILINETDHIVIGAGAGLSTAAGIDYGGKRFKKNFKDFIDKYNFTDMYTAGFYPFENEQEKWAYWARHISMNNVDMPATPLYKKLLRLVENKDYFVITTNVDDQFLKSGFDSKRIFATQGSYAKLQCKKACHDKLYDDEDIVHEMLEKTNENLAIPHNLVPVCPVCGGPMEVHLRSDNYFVENDDWHKQSNAYYDFLQKAKYDKTLLIEFGIGFNTPIIIRLPFDKMLFEFDYWNLVRFNRSHLEVSVEIDDKYHLFPLEALDSHRFPSGLKERYIPFNEDIEEIIDKLID